MKLKNWVNKKATAVMAGIMGAFAFLPQCVYADAFSDAAEQAASGIQASAAGAAKWLLMIALVIAGLMLIIGTQRQKDGIKEQAPLVLLGIALIVCAGAISTLIFGWF